MTSKLLIPSTVFIVLIISCKKEVKSDAVISLHADNGSKPVSIGIKGDTSDVNSAPTPGFVLMGGGADVDEAIEWMLARSGHGDVVVIRASGSTAYNNYMYNLYQVNSVETLLINSKAKANDVAVADKIKKAECLFIAGGDQWDYVYYWKGSLVNDAINYLINTKKVPVGGTSAGCMILGNYCFDASNGTVTSGEVLKNPYNKYTTFTSHFINIPFLKNIITDTHYNFPDRRGRQTGFMARLFKDSAVAIKGIGVQEETAVAIDENGTGKVFGYGAAFFLHAQTNLGLPETCIKHMPLTWNKSKQAVKVYKINGTKKGNGTIDIKHFNNFSGGSYQYFYAKNGTFAVD